MARKTPKELTPEVLAEVAKAIEPEPFTVASARKLVAAYQADLTAAEKARLIDMIAAQAALGGTRLVVADAPPVRIARLMEWLRGLGFSVHGSQAIGTLSIEWREEAGHGVE